MAKRKPRRQRRPFIPIDPKYKEYFKDAGPSYKKWEVLSHFITERGKIMPRTRTGISARMQRKLSREVKHARHLALLPFVVKPS